ncbi:hypothetical protein P7K49_002551 [Saguinus oedipus]|uniref:Uncharacterized protein n=1 Tax=Saguinus oedipus TaxID=9490 RepID=A0ABQ9WI77_SAGOE|nr:hypothetical protein P7K49_002551 [Saguinus oedipus]
MRLRAVRFQSRRGGPVSDHICICVFWTLPLPKPWATWRSPRPGINRLTRNTLLRSGQYSLRPHWGSSTGRGNSPAAPACLFAYHILIGSYRGARPPPSTPTQWLGAGPTLAPPPIRWSLPPPTLAREPEAEGAHAPGCWVDPHPPRRLGSVIRSCPCESLKAKATSPTSDTSNLPRVLPGRCAALGPLLRLVSRGLRPSRGVHSPSNTPPWCHFFQEAFTANSATPDSIHALATC